MATGCIGSHPPGPPEDMYQQWMNMPVPSTVSDLAYGELSGQSGTESYLTYYTVAQPDKVVEHRAEHS